MELIYKYAVGLSVLKNHGGAVAPSKVWDFIPNTCPPRTIFWEHQLRFKIHLKMAGED